MFRFIDQTPIFIAKEKYTIDYFGYFVADFFRDRFANDEDVKQLLQVVVWVEIFSNNRFVAEISQR